jgi:hypothetical protein
MVLVGGFLIGILVAWTGPGSLAANLTYIWTQFDSETPGAAWILAGIFALIEAFHLAVAVLFMPWGAKDEPLRKSFQNSLRQTWLHTVHFLPAIAIVGGLVLWFHVVKQRLGSAPSEVVIAAAVVVTLAWVLFALARAIAAPRCGQPPQRPPMCTNCGYNLTTIARDSRCPECGVLAAESLDFSSQAGTPWERCDRLAAIARAWKESAATAIFAPDRLGRSIRMAQPSAHRSFLALHLPCVFFIGVASLLIHVARFEDVDWMTKEAVAVGCVVTVFSIGCVAASFAVVNLAALLIGLIESWWTKRNMLPASAQMACYLAPCIVGWQLTGAALLLLITQYESFFRTLEEMTGTYRDVLAVFAFILPNLIILLTFLYLIARGTKAARYANK